MALPFVSLKYMKENDAYMAVILITDSSLLSFTIMKAVIFSVKNSW